MTYSFELSFSSSLFFSIEGHSGSHLYPPRELCSCVMNVPTSACTATFGFQNMSEFCNYGEKIVKNHSLLSHQCTLTIHRPMVHITCQWRNKCIRGDGCTSWSTQILKHSIRSRRHVRDILGKFLALFRSLDQKIRWLPQTNSMCEVQTLYSCSLFRLTAIIFDRLLSTLP